MKKIDLMNEAECREHSITTARELTSAGFTVVLDDIRKIPAYLIRNKNGKIVFYVDPCYSLEGILKSNCEAIFTYNNIPRELIEDDCMYFKVRK